MIKKCLLSIVIVLSVVFLTTSIIRAIIPKKPSLDVQTTQTEIKYEHEAVQEVLAVNTEANLIEQVVGTSKKTVDFIEEEVIIPEAKEEEEKIEPETILTQSSLSDEDIEALAKTLYGEANCVSSACERSMVVWTILNRLDAGGFGETVYEICTKPMQFTGYNPDHPVTERNLELVRDVVSRWEREKNGEENVGRTLPKEYCFFVADSNPSAGEWHNAFYAYSGGNRGDKIWYSYLNPIDNPY